MEKHKCLISSYIFIQLRFCCLIVFILFFSKITEAQSVTIGAGTTSLHIYGPYYRSTATSTFNYSRYCYLYSASELGIPSGATITKIEWLKASGTISAPNIFQILLKNSTSTSLITGASWSSLSSGATSVYSSTNQSFLLTSGWEAFNFTTGFNYTGGSLMILTDHIKSGTASGANNYYYSPAIGKSLGFASSVTPTTLSSATYGDNRPNIRITYTTCASQPINPSNAIICQPGIATISATPASGTNTIRWYTTASGGTLLFTGNNYSANYTSGTTLYAASYNTISGCESAFRTAVNIIITPIQIQFVKIAPNGVDSNAVIAQITNGTAPYSYDWSIDGVGDFDDVKNQYDLLPGIYTLEVKDQLNCRTKDSIGIYKDIIIPTGISPDGDGINDTWNITGWEQFSDIEVQVTNILGQVIHFQKGTYIPWDGKLDGKTINKGEYFFHISSSKLKLNKTGMLVVKY